MSKARTYDTRQMIAEEPAPPVQPEPKSPTCLNCDAWFSLNGVLGSCKRNPPSILVKTTEIGPLCAFPVTAAAESCRQYRERK